MTDQDHRRGATRAREGSEAGFTLVELLMYLIVSVGLLTAVYGVLIGESRHVRGQLETRDVRETLRGALGLLATDIRHLSASRGDLYAIDAHSLTLRSMQGAGLVCGLSPYESLYAVWRPGGTIEREDKDSVLLYDPAAGWASAAIKKTQEPKLSTIPNCTWSALKIPGVVVETDTTIIASVGSPLLAFKHVEYGMFRWEERWWLGQKVSGRKTFELLTGPLLPPQAGGLVFRYFDASGSETGDPSQVARIELVIRGESQRHRPGAISLGGDVATASPTYATDSLVAHVYLRN